VRLPKVDSLEGFHGLEWLVSVSHAASKLPAGLESPQVDLVWPGHDIEQGMLCFAQELFSNVPGRVQVQETTELHLHG